MKVLVADDDRSTRFILRQILVREFGAEVVEVDDGAKALSAIGRQAFDVLLLDLHMPMLDGVGVLSAVRSVPQLRAIPVVIMSADRDEAHVRQALALGVADYLTKPFHADQLRERLHKLVDQLADADRALSTSTPEPAPQP
jgi:CheY-like chemotaxis protein